MKTHRPGQKSEMLKEARIAAATAITDSVLAECALESSESKRYDIIIRGMKQVNELLDACLSPKA